MGVKSMKKELEKLFQGKLILSLIFLSVTINFGLLLLQKDKIDVLQVFDDFIEENGNRVSNKKMDILKDIWNEEISNSISWEDFENNLKSATLYSKSIKSSDMASAYISLMHLEGKAAEYVQAEFSKLDEQIKEASKQELTFFPPYQMYLFDFISAYLLFAINLEGIVVAVIVTLYSIEIERSSRTSSIVYSTKKGIKIFKDKLFASLVVSMICFLLIIGITLLLAGCIFPVNTMLNTLISNPMVNLKGAPCITNESMSISKYIFNSMGMSCILTVTYSLGSFAVAIKAKNGYYAFGAIFVLLGMMKVFSAVSSTATYMFFWTKYNPIDMALKAGTWFLYNPNNFSPPGYEKYTVMLWLSICVGGCICGLYRINKKSERGYF